MLKIKRGFFAQIFALIAGLLILTAFLPGCGTTPKLAAFGGAGNPSDPVPFTEAVRTGTLPSGLRYYILENSRPENRAYLTLAVNAGSVLETDDEQGLAHFVEHMAFNGTTRFPESELINYLRSLGMRFGPEVNAYTSYDETVFGIEVPVEAGPGGEKRIPDTALAVLDDWTRAITFDPKDVDDERLVIMEEYRAYLGAMERLRKQILPFIFQGSPYANRSPIGLPEIIQGAPASRLENFYKKWYRADNMALILVGDFDGAAMEASLGAHFSIEKPNTPLNRPAYDLPRPKKGDLQTLILTDPELPLTQVNLYHKRSPRAPESDLAAYREEIIDSLIDQILSLRFSEAAQDPESPYVNAGSGSVRFGHSSRYYALIALPKTGQAEASLAALLREKESLSRYGFTAGDLNIAKNALLSNLEQAVSEKDRQESEHYVSALTSYFLQGGTLVDVEWELETARQLLPGIAAGDISAVLKDYFKSGELKIFIIAPEAEKDTLPTDARIRQLVKESARLKISPPESTEVDAGLAGEPFQPGQITAESVDRETGALRWELSNGARVILKETKNRNNEVAFYAMARGGTTSALETDLVSAGLASELIQASGLGPYSLPELMKKLADKQVSLSFQISPYYRGFQGSAAGGDLGILFEMIYLYFTDSRIYPRATGVMLDQLRTDLARRDENPETVFSDEIVRITTGGSPWFKPLELADLAKVDTDKALAFIRRSLNPADYTFVFVGNLDLEALRLYAETWLASIPRSEAWNVWQNLNITRPGKTSRPVYKGKEERSAVYMVWYDKVPYSEEASAAAAVLSEYLEIRATEEIREKLGGVYSISMSASISPIPDGELSLEVYFACDPRRAEELTAEVTNLIRQTAAGAIHQDTFAKSVEAMKKEWESSIQSNAYIARSYANSSALLDLPLSRLDKRPAYYGAVKPGDLQRFCARLLPKGPAVIILYPEEK
ncbi:MAG: insulinase family protein [Treponema sp.]|jgi:zinc protease|nr:insulinase family protein [Treponema sp.]